MHSRVSVYDAAAGKGEAGFNPFCSDSCVIHNNTSEFISSLDFCFKSKIRWKQSSEPSIMNLLGNFPGQSTCLTQPNHMV